MSDQSRFDGYTKQLRDAFPTWSRIRKDKKSIGAQFLSVIGAQLDEMEWVLNYAEQQYRIGTADLTQADIIYKAQLSSKIDTTTRYAFTSETHVLRAAATIEEFLLPEKEVGQLPELYFDTKYFIDFTSNYIYVKHPYGANPDYPDGQLTLTLYSPTGEEIWSDPIPLLVHHVWNFFDEFGLLLDTPRLYGEKNKAYKERILDVFRRPASSTYRGLMNGIARELGLVYEAQWHDGEKDLQLYHSRIDTGSIYVDDLLIDEDSFTRDASGRVILSGSSFAAGEERMVRYVAGITLHELHDKTDDAFQQELFKPDGTASDRLTYYAKQIHNYIPIMWGQWKWNQGIWDSAEESILGYGALPTVYDASFAGWNPSRPKGG